MDVMVLMHQVQRRATITALRENPEWLLVDLDAFMQGDGVYAEHLSTVTVGELRDEALGPPPVQLHVARALTGAEFDEMVHAVLLEVGRFVPHRDLRSRLGGPRWKLQAALGRLVDAGRAERIGVTSDAAYRGVE